MLSPGTQWFLIISGLVVSAILVYVIRRQLKPVSPPAQNKGSADKPEEARLGAAESIQVIARAMLAGQVELSEGCIRIKVLLDAIDPELQKDARLTIFQQLYEETRHMPTHSARESVDKRFLFKMDKQRWELENQHRSEILAACRELLTLSLSRQ